MKIVMDNKTKTYNTKIWYIIYILSFLKQFFIQRSLNEGFSGGEKKRNEIFQMAMLEPTLSILDETDSGLDIDALKIVSHGVNALKTKDNATILITHYQRLLDYIIPDYVHVLYKGKIVKSGDKIASIVMIGFPHIIIS